jgi:hypothetical protein
MSDGAFIANPNPGRKPRRNIAPHTALAPGLTPGRQDAAVYSMPR